MRLSATDLTVKKKKKKCGIIQVLVLICVVNGESTTDGFGTAEYINSFVGQNIHWNSSHHPVWLPGNTSRKKIKKHFFFDRFFEVLFFESTKFLVSLF